MLTELMREAFNLFSSVHIKNKQLPKICGATAYFPQEIWLRFMEELNLRDLNRFSQTCKIFYKLSSSALLWMNRLKKDFFITFTCTEAAKTLYKNYYNQTQPSRLQAENNLIRGSYSKIIHYHKIIDKKDLNHIEDIEKSQIYFDNDVFTILYYFSHKTLVKQVNYFTKEIKLLFEIENTQSVVKLLEIHQQKVLITLRVEEQILNILFFQLSGINLLIENFSSKLYLSSELDYLEKIKSLIYFEQNNCSMIAIATSVGRMITFNAQTGVEYLRSDKESHSFFFYQDCFFFHEIDCDIHLFLGGGKLKKWNLTTNRSEVINIRTTLEDPVWSTSLIIDKNKTEIAFGFRSGKIALWDLKQFAKTCEYQSRVGEVKQLIGASMLNEQFYGIFSLGVNNRITVKQYQNSDVKTFLQLTKKSLCFGFFYQNNLPFFIVINEDGSLTRFDFENHVN